MQQKRSVCCPRLDRVWFFTGELFYRATSEEKAQAAAELEISFTMGRLVTEVVPPQLEVERAFIR
jgi:hypothetical protein